MATRRISFTSFDRRLVLSGGREQAGVAALRRASGVAQELTTSVMSRWGSLFLYPINAIQMFYWNGHRFAYDGAKLYQDGGVIKTGFNGNRITFNTMPPQPGLQDYLFILGGGVTPFKIDPNGIITNWGIQEPPNQMTAQNLANDQIVIDSFTGSAANWTASNATKADNNTEFATGTGSLSINPSATPWHIKRNVATLNLGTYSNNDISMGTDIFQMWALYTGSTNTGQLLNAHYLQIDFDVRDGTFTKDYYSVSVGMIPFGATNPHVNHIIAISFDVQPGQWQQLTIPKSLFNRIGTELDLDWTNVQEIRISGNNFAGDLLLDNFTLSGGSALAAGPAAGNGGAEYDYYAVFRSLVTGSQSNPNADPVKLFAVSVNKTQLNNIPVSPDSQVGARDLYRTQQLNVAGGTGNAFFLDTIYDNTTTTYIDSTADFSYPVAATPWQKEVTVPPNAAAPYYIDAGNGYYFKLTAAGTTGANPPQWVIPTSQWAANAAFLAGETVAPIKAAGHFWKVTTAGISGNTPPNWAAAGPLTDGTVVWTDQGLKVTQDNSVQWTFQGINSTATLDGSKPLLFDNAPPQETYDDAYGPFEGSMIWTRDTAQGKAGYIYASPPGRPESVGQAYLVTGTDDPMQKVVVWDSRLWALSQAKAFRSTGQYPALAFPTIDDALGTRVPFTVVAVQYIGIVYWAPDGIRVLNFSGSRLIGFQQLAPIFRGQPEEDVPAWNQTNGPLWAEHGRNELLFSDGATLTLGILYDGLTGDGPVWRLPGRVLTAAYYEHQTGELGVAFGGKVYLFEHPGHLTDG